MLKKMRAIQRPAAFSEKQPISLFILIALLVVLLHIMAIKWLENPQDMPTDSNQPIPFKLEVSLLTKNRPKSIAAPPTIKPAPNHTIKPKSVVKPKPEHKPEAKKAILIKEKSPDLGEIAQLIKANSVKEVSKTVNYKPGQQTAQSISAAMVVPSSAQASAKDNFPISDTHNPSPEYPEMAIFLGYQGNAIIRIKVSAKGASEGVEVLSSSGHKTLDESATKALKKWRFTPSKLGNTAVASSVVITVSYVLYYQR
jgi:protein TonB